MTSNTLALHHNPEAESFLIAFESATPAARLDTMDLILAEDDETEATPDDGTPVMSRDQEKRLRRAIREAQAIEATATANR